MLKTFTLGMLIGIVALSARSSAAQDRSATASTLRAQLALSRSIFVVPTQGSGTRKPPTATWFVYQDGAIYTTVSAADQRARSIQAGKPDASIRIDTPDGPALVATGAIIKDPAVYRSVLAGLEKKYPDAWKDYGGGLRYNLMQGYSRLIKYTLNDS